MDQPLVSAVIPVYNGERHLRETLDSVLAQMWPHLEVVVVNDGSTDGSAEIIASYGDRLVAIDQENQGVAGARNTALRQARGKYVAFVDQDDRWLPEKTAKQVAVFEADDRVGLVHTDVQHYDEDAGRFVGPLDPTMRREEMTGDCYEKLLLSNPICNSSVMVRASVLEKSGLCSPEIRGNTIQDYDLWLRMAPRCRFGYVDEPLTIFRVHSQQGMAHWSLVRSEEARLLERILSERNGLADGRMRRRMALLYDDLGTAQLDEGSRGEARRSFARSVRWHFNRRAAVRWAACWLPGGVIRRLKRTRSSLAALGTTAQRRRAGGG